MRSIVHEMQGQEREAPDGCFIDRKADGAVVLQLPMEFKKRGGRKEIILPAGRTTETTYSPEQRKFLLTLARAHRLKDLLESGSYPTIKALAAALDLDRSYVAKLLNLALLAPDIIEDAVAGNESATLSIAKLRQGVPVSWEEQREMLMLERAER